MSARATAAAAVASDHMRTPWVLFADDGDDVLPSVVMTVVMAVVVAVAIVATVPSSSALVSCEGEGKDGGSDGSGDAAESGEEVCLLVVVFTARADDDAIAAALRRSICALN